MNFVNYKDSWLRVQEPQYSTIIVNVLFDRKEDLKIH